MNRSTARLLRAARRGASAVSSLLEPSQTKHGKFPRPPNPAARSAVEEKTEPPAPPVDISGQAASDAIRDGLAGTEPCMIARLGHTETKALMRFRMQQGFLPLSNVWRYVTRQQDEFWWDENLRWEMQFSSGYFPCTEAALNRFSERYLRDLGSIDILGAWLPQEKQLRPYFPSAVRVPLQNLEPFEHNDPWTTALAGKRVLVVHPFETTIRTQFKKRTLLFRDPRLLPEFELLTLKAVQSLGGHTGGFATWFDALESMMDAISKLEFDIAIIGAGAYGLPLAAHIKSLGRKAFHLGGASQLLFGVRGKRWEEREFYRALMNEHWVRPAPDETPSGHHHVDEGKSYW